MNRVSVVMGTCNGAGHISAQLESIRRQTLQPFDLWISDDGSSDETLRIVSAFAETAPFPVRIWVNTEHAGLCDRILDLVSLCEGDVIALCGQDGEWHPQKLEECCGGLEREGAVLCAHTTTLLDSASRYAGYLPQGIAVRHSFPPLSLPPWGEFLAPTLVFRRELLGFLEARDRGPDPFAPGERLRHDRWIYFLAHSLGHIVTLPRPLMSHRQPQPTPRGILARMGMARGLPTPRAMTEALERRRAAASHRAQLMSALGRQGRHGPIAERARAAALYWQRFDDICALRISLYQSSSFARRRAAFSRLMALGVYGRGTGRGVRAATLALDVCLGLISLADGGTRPVEARAGRSQAQRKGAAVRLDDHA